MKHISSRENRIVRILATLGLIWLIALFLVTIRKNRALPPSVQICKNLVQAKMISESECMKSEPRAASRYVEFYFPKNKVSEEFVRTGMSGFVILDEGSGRCSKSPGMCSSVEYIIINKLIWDETYTFVFRDEVLNSWVWHH